MIRRTVLQVTAKFREKYRGGFADRTVRLNRIASSGKAESGGSGSSKRHVILPS